MDSKLFDRSCESVFYTSVEGSFSFRQYLTIEEELQIRQQFLSTWRWNSQVMWSGVHRGYAQDWADKHDMVTLTTAMGPLMIPEHVQCLKTQKTSPGWSKYIKGASALFAWHISRGDKVTVLSPPPPERFHPSGKTNYQAIEEPILKGEKEGGARLRLEMVHPMVPGAENFKYQIWPVDQTNTWVERFGTLAQGARCWRLVKQTVEKGKITNIAREREKVASEKAEEEKATKEKKKMAAREKIARDKAAKEEKKTAAREKAAREKAAKEMKKTAAREKAAREKAAKEMKKMAAGEKMAREKVVKEMKKTAAREKLAREKVAKEKKKTAAREKIAREKAIKKKKKKKKKTAARETAILNEKLKAVLKEKVVKGQIVMKKEK